MSQVTQGADWGREVRLGLVLYGGVSLAIYMNGTTNELFRAVRGRGVYFLIKHLLGADIGVDVASGASAGGINGIFLAFALANDREFGTCAELWRRDGDLGSLFRSLGDDAVPSVLDSPHYRDVLVLCELSELSYAEAAQVCGIEIGTVRSRLSRARAQLAETLAPPARAKEAV